MGRVSHLPAAPPTMTQTCGPWYHRITGWMLHGGSETNQPSDCGHGAASARGGKHTAHKQHRKRKADSKQSRPRQRQAAQPHVKGCLAPVAASCCMLVGVPDPPSCPSGCPSWFASVSLDLLSSPFLRLADHHDHDQSQASIRLAVHKQARQQQGRCRQQKASGMGHGTWASLQHSSIQKNWPKEHRRSRLGELCGEVQVKARGLAWCWTRGLSGLVRFLHAPARTPKQ